MDERPKTLQQAIKEQREETLNRIASNRDMPSSMRTKAILHMAAVGMKSKDIAAEMGISSARVGSILNSSGAKAEVARLQEQLFVKNPQQMFQKLVPKAYRRVNALMNKTEKGSTQLGAINIALDRAFGKPTQTVEHQGSGIKDILMALDKENRKKEDIAAGIVVEAEFTEVAPPKDAFDSILDDL